MCLSILQARLQPIKALSDRYAIPVILLAARVMVGRDFLKSGLTKVAYIANGEIDTLYYLFAEEYKVPFLPVKLAAWMGTIGETTLPLLLALGLFTRFGALGLIVLSGVIFATDGNPIAMYWAIVCAIIVTHGAGRLSLDSLIFTRK